MVGYVANSGINKLDEHNYVLIVMCQGFKYKTYQMDQLIEEFLESIKDYLS